ncbi:MAG: hypothetical protein LBP91_00515 [Coriobacteriales bacterium]|jgi:hypothetical protein|nr:hypothetical protein [Coriobacteriales bacterium]
MSNSVKKKNSWKRVSSNEKPDAREVSPSTLANALTVLLTVIIIAGGFMLPTLTFPLLDSYSNRSIQLTSPSDDMISGHIFEEPVTLYPWNIYDEARTRKLTVVEMAQLDQSGVIDLLISTMQHHSIALGYRYEVYQERILSSFHWLEPVSASDAGCFVMVEADIDFDGNPDASCAVDLNGNLISLLFVSDTWGALRLTDPIAVPPEQAQVNAEGSGNAPTSSPAGETPALQNLPSAPNGSPVDYLPLQEDESIWLFSYVLSREALIAGQSDVYYTFRQLDLYYEERFAYPYINLIPAPPDYVETLPNIEPIAITYDNLSTDNYLHKIYDFANGTRLILYINPLTQNCDGFNLAISTVFTTS